MVWWLGRPSQRTTVTDNDNALGKFVVFRTAIKPHYITYSDTDISNDVVVTTALTALQK